MNRWFFRRLMADATTGRRRDDAPVGRSTGESDFSAIPPQRSPQMSGNSPESNEEGGRPPVRPEAFLWPPPKNLTELAAYLGQLSVGESTGLPRVLAANSTVLIIGFFGTMMCTGALCLGIVVSIVSTMFMGQPWPFPAKATLAGIFATITFFVGLVQYMRKVMGGKVSKTIITAGSGSPDSSNLRPGDPRQP